MGTASAGVKLYINVGWKYDADLKLASDDANPFSAASCLENCVVAVGDLYGGGDGFNEFAIGNAEVETTFPLDFYVSPEISMTFTYRDVTTFDSAEATTSYGQYPVLADLDNDGAPNG